jgi:L-lactate dehydrogenase
MRASIEMSAYAGMRDVQCWPYAVHAHPSSTVRVAVVGVGHVGATFAFTLVRSGLASEIRLVDDDRARAEGEAMDLEHAVPFGRPVRISRGGFEDCADADIVVVTGAGQRVGETRLDLAKRNAEVFRTIIPQIARHAPDTVLVIATNPVDVLTMGARSLSGFAASRVIGSGTILDTARIRSLLSRRFDVDARSIHAHVIGEHGDTSLVAWSAANIAGIPLDRLETGQPFGPDEREALARETRDAAYAIIERKGHTAFAIAAGLVRIVEAIVRDEHSVLTVSSPLGGAYGIDDVCLSLPTSIAREGIDRVLPLLLDPRERQALEHSANTIRKAALASGFAQ